MACVLFSRLWYVCFTKDALNTQNSDNVIKTLIEQKIG